jgi:hypothetical protein
MDSLTLSKPRAAQHRAKTQAKAADSFLRRKRARAKLEGMRRAGKGLLMRGTTRRAGGEVTHLTRPWLEVLAGAIEERRAAGLPADRRKTKALWLAGGESDSLALTSPLRIALIVCDSILRSYDYEDEDGEEKRPPHFLTVAGAIGRTLGVYGRNSLGYRDRRQAKRQREQVGLELLQIAAEIGFINPLKDPRAKPTRKGGKRSAGQRCELTDKAALDLADIHARLAIANDYRTDQVLFEPPPAGSAVVITENWCGWEETPECTAPAVIRAVDLAQRTAWRICDAILDEVLEGRDPVDRVKRATVVWQRTRALLERSKINTRARLLARARLARARDEMNKWLTIVQASALRGRTFYFKCRLDYRGRIYQIGSHLGYTGGDDLARALLEFADGEALPIDSPIDGILRRHLSAMYGHGEGKKSDLERTQFDPAAAVLEPKKPWRYRAAVLAYELFKADKPIHTPVAFDCTSSGLQIYAALLRDEALGRRVNMFADDDLRDEETGERVWDVTKPLEDIYADIGAEVHGIDREDIKPLVLPQLYGAGPPLQARTLAGLRKHPAPTARDKADVAQVRKALERLAPAFGTLLAWLRCQADTASSAGQPFDWTLGDGFTVLQDSRIVKKRSAKYCVPGIAKQITYASMDPTKEISAELQKRQTGANYIHSFDAYFWRQVITYCGEECSVFDRPASFALAHDSFGVPAGDAHTLLWSLTRAVREVYGPDWIAIHADHWRIKPPAHDEMLSEGWSLGSLVE